MKPRIKLDEAKTPDGGTLALFEHDGSYGISLDGKELMHSRMSFSEEALGRIGVEGIKSGQPGNILIGGLGLGFTLRTAFDSAGVDVAFDVVELSSAVIEWNRSHLRTLNGSCLENTRVRVFNADITNWIRTAPAHSYDAILLDVDNGPIAMVDQNNTTLYSEKGIRQLCRLLKPGGRLAIWSASKDGPFESRLKRAQLPFRIVSAKAHERAKREAVAIYVIQP